MRVGIRILLPGTDPSIAIEPMLPHELARHLEDRGFESLWLPEHTHLPVQSALPGAATLPSLYQNSYDPLVALTAAAAATRRLRVATGVCLLAQRDPISLAKQIATLDVLSEGRFIFGIGFGWNRPELLHHGVRWADRRSVVREHVLAMKALWTQDTASFTGTHVAFGPSWSWPKPVQRPHPPIFLGARAGPATFANIVELADGWLPNEPDDLRRLPELRRAAEDHGRDPDSIDVTFYGAAATTARQLDEYAEQGIRRVVFWISSGSRTEVLRAVDRLCVDLAQTVAGLTP